MRKIICLTIFMIFMAGCVRTSSLIKKLNQNSYPLWYSYDTVPIKTKQNIRFGLTKIEITMDHFPDAAMAKKHTGSIFPLIFSAFFL